MTSPNSPTDDDVPADAVARIRENGAPSHVAVIMDGNGRWARQRGLPRSEGHRAGMAAVREVINGALEAGLQHLTLYAFSQENWDRPTDEVAALMALLEEYAKSDRGELADAGIHVTVFGDLTRLSSAARDAVDDLQAGTASGAELHLHLAISYGSRSEIVEACREIVRSCEAGELVPEEIGPEDIGSRLMTADRPDPDLLIRTSGEYRISNFMLWQVAYAEFYVTPVLWPDFTRQDLFRAILDYQRRERRFGLVST